MNIPILKIGIMNEKKLKFHLKGDYKWLETDKTVNGTFEACFHGDKIEFDGHKYDELTFSPIVENAEFMLEEVTIGVRFHWQRKTNQRYSGVLRLLATDNGIQVINEIDTEEYLMRVISAEMNENAPEEFLKAHAVISRSWVMAQIDKTINSHTENEKVDTDERTIKWYDKDDHSLFDVCADDHCQRYQGIGEGISDKVKKIVNSTKGEILRYNGKICDTRFSKCCGGVSEEFEHCWQPTHYDYLSAIRDSKDKNVPDLTNETAAERWILSSPKSFCDTKDSKILSTILNSYDQETKDFYRWTVEYTQKELSELIYRKSGLDFGQIIDLQPLKRGKSGRIEELRVVGTLGNHIFGKELEIRRILSETHLYSSAFIVRKELDNSGAPTKFVIKGAGWGHGVGLCQIGAAVMGCEGYGYREILAHYFKGASLEMTY